MDLFGGDGMFVGVIVNNYGRAIFNRPYIGHHFHRTSGQGETERVLCDSGGNIHCRWLCKFRSDLSDERSM